LAMSRATEGFSVRMTFMMLEWYLKNYHHEDTKSTKFYCFVLFVSSW